MFAPVHGGPGSVQCVVLGYEGATPGSISWMIGTLPVHLGDHSLEIPLRQVTVVCCVFTKTRMINCEVSRSISDAQ